MYLKNLFSVVFLVMVVFSVIKGSAGDEDDERKNKLKKFCLLMEESKRKGQIAWENKKTPLTLAAAQGNVEAVQLLLAGNADVNQKDGEGMTPLMEAASRAQPRAEGYRAVVQCLLDVQADVNVIDTEGRDALLMALGSELGVPSRIRDVEHEGFDEMMVRLLVEARADVARVDNQGRTTLDQAAGFYDSLINLLEHAYVGPDQASNERWQEQITDARDRQRRWIKTRAEWFSSFCYRCAE